MQLKHFETTQFLKTDLKFAWDFFSTPKNLAKITPADMDFKILTDLKDEEIYEGMIIDYTVKPLAGVPLHWQTEICKVKSMVYFTDRQLKGPYKVWEHTHLFREVKGGVQMDDVLEYQLPLGILGDLAHSLLVRNKIEKIFEYRRNMLENLFNKTTVAA